MSISYLIHVASTSELLEIVVLSHRHRRHWKIGLPAHFDYHDCSNVRSTGLFLYIPCYGLYLHAFSGPRIHSQKGVHVDWMDGGLHLIVGFLSKYPVMFTDVVAAIPSTVSSCLSTHSGAWTTSVGVTHVWSLAREVARRLS